MHSLQPKAFASFYGTDLELTEKAFANIASRKVVILAVSGKLGAGKDSVAPLVIDKLGHPEALQEIFAKPLKDEVDEAIAVMSESPTQETAVALIAVEQNITLAQAAIVVARLWVEVKNLTVTTSRTRTDNTRFVLQFWGTDIRRTQDENYWVKLAIGSTIDKLADGKSAFVTDARFENEIDSLTALGAYTVRLKVSPEVQSQRINDRDGITPTDEARGHLSETALDDYEARGLFTVIVDTDVLTLTEVVDEVLTGILIGENK